MRIALKVTVLALLAIIVLTSCKKSSSRISNAGMAGMRTWVQTTVNSNVDSIGIRHFDTTYSTVRTHVNPLNSSTILIYHDSASVYADTLTGVTSHAPGIISFAEKKVYTTIYMMDTLVDTRYDSVAYDASANSMVWYDLATNSRTYFPSDSVYTISHTP